MKDLKSEITRLHLFSCIKLTKGVKRGVLLDVERGTFLLVPNDLVDFLLQNKGKKITDIYSSYEKENKDVVEEYFEFLIENDIIFFNELSSRSFPDISHEWDSYSTITNCILDVESIHSIINLKKIIHLLEDLNCQHIELRFFFKINLQDLKEIVSNFDNSIIKSIDLTLPFIDRKLELEKLLDEYSRIMDVNLYNKDKKCFESEYPIFFMQSVNPSLSCGVVKAKNFSLSLNAYTESRIHNSCLNRKLSINLDTGDIKNCPSLKEIHGNYLKDNVNVVVTQNNFQKLWHITKNDIDQCKVCEFRDICSDCRAFTDSNNNNLGKPLKCGYDPYTGEWENWEENKGKKIIFKEICASL